MKYIDVNVFVYWLGDDPNFGGIATGIVERIEGGEKTITSALTPWLIHVILEREARGYSPKGLIEELASVRNLRIVPLKVGDYEGAVDLAERHRLDLEDALHLRVALENGAKQIYSADEDFDRTPLERVFG